jgi:uncharacterized protein YgbK (DUF1537 family)
MLFVNNRRMSSRRMAKCLVIADDLTGACDAGVQFARHGLSCDVQCEPVFAALCESDVVAFNTDSRCGSIAKSQRRLRHIANACDGPKTPMVFKKIDSTLRGNVGGEITVALSCFDCECAIVAPAFPAMRRVVRNGVLEWSDLLGSRRLKITALLAEQDIALAQMALLKTDSYQHRTFRENVSAQIANGAKVIVADSELQDDLRFLVAAGSKIRRRILWVGSAGLGNALAEHIGTESATRTRPPVRDASVLFCIGSTHPVTTLQKIRLLRSTAAVEVLVGPESIKSVRAAIRERRHVIALTGRVEVAETLLREFACGLEGLPLAGVFLTGGDTGTLVCKVFGVRAIRLYDEIAAGIPWGRLQGGPLHNLPVATKSGGFGEEDALLRVAKVLAPTTGHCHD